MHAKRKTLQQFYQQQSTDFGSVITGSAAVAGADSGAGEEAPGRAGTWGLSRGFARTRLQSGPKRR